MRQYRFTLKKMLLHLKTITKHKWYVFIYCCKCGIPWQGIIHDLSKFSPKEFITNVKFTEPGISPIDIQKRDIGYSFPWQHHKGRNPHHYEFWMDNFDGGCYVHKMPFKYMVELLCDQLAANKTYKKGATYHDEYKWWQNQKTIRNMHPNCTEFLNIIIEYLDRLETFDEKYKENAFYLTVRIDKNRTERFVLTKPDDVLKKSVLKAIYDKIENESNYPSPCKIRQPEREV